MLHALNFHLVSDSTCQTVKTVAAEALGYFQNLQVNYYHWPLLATQEDLNNCLDKIGAKPGFILYTLKEGEISKRLLDFCAQNNLPCASAIESVVNVLKSYLGSAILGTQPSTRLNAQYFSKLEAMNFAIKHDDGQSTETIDQSDIIIVGASRSSKTPTSMYLAYNGYKTANVPYIPNIELPIELKKITHILIIGLSINPSRLAEIRYNRLAEIGGDLNSDYIKISAVNNECKLAKQEFMQYNWPIIDVTYRSIEETAAAIMKLYYNFQRKIKYGQN